MIFRAESRIEYHAENVPQAWALVAEFVQHGSRDQVARDLNIAQSGAEPDADQSLQNFRGVDMKSGVLRSQGDSRPQATVICYQAPFLADLSKFSQFTEVKVTRDV